MVVVLLLVVVEVMVVVVVVVVVVIVARREKEEEKEVEVEETAVAEMEEEEEATVLRKADTRGGWEQCRSMPASQPASRPNPSESTALQFPNPLPRFSTPTSADSPGDKTRTAPRATPTHPARRPCRSALFSPLFLSLSRSPFFSFPMSSSPSPRPLSSFCSPFLPRSHSLDLSFPLSKLSFVSGVRVVTHTDEK